MVNIKKTIKQMQELAESRGGKFLSNEYINRHTKHLWECAEGHQWEATPGRIMDTPKLKGTWCPACYNKKRKRR